VLAISTQVCEMSLDLDADVLVTEEAPVTALIQRMGRCCRESLPTAGRHGDVLVYAPENEKPYKLTELAGVTEFVTRLAAMPRVSQVELEAALGDAPQAPELPKESQFLQSGPWAMSGEDAFREIEAWTRPAVLARDVYDFARLRRSRTESWKADGLVIPLPVYLAKDRDPRLPSYLFVADGAHYSQAVGFLDKPRPRKPVIV
jgi:CRISPR-associated endonuclease/helicase Cas3